MSSDSDVDRCLGQIRELAGSLGDEVLALPPEAWDGPTNCPPWKVRQLIAHVVMSGDGFRQSVERGLAGSVEPPHATGADRDRQIEELSRSDPATLVAALNGVTEGFEALYRDLDEAGLESICFHRRGNRSARWYAYHRLAEVAFHRWDFHQSLGRVARFDDGVALTLLPTLLESNAPRTYAAGLSDERGSGERYLLAADGDPTARWLVTVQPDRLDVTRGDGPADASIAGPAGQLALLIYGRAALDELRRTGTVRVEGDEAIAERFPRLFPRP